MRSTFFIENRRELRQLVAGGETIVITANGLVQRNGDVTFPFRQDSNFWYLSGIDEPDLVLVIDGTGEYLIAPGRSQARSIFDGALDLDKLADKSGISDILDERTGWQRFCAGSKPGRVATLAPSASYDRRYSFYAGPARSRLVKKLKRLVPDTKIVDIRPVLAGMRVVKQPEELAAIQKAVDITAAGIAVVAGRLDRFGYEYEIEASLTASFRASGAGGHSFGPIIAGGENACTLHNIANNSRLTAGELVTIDVGAEADNYAADITRTLALGEVNARQRQVHNSVVAAQNFALELLKPGICLRDYEAEVAGFLGHELVELGLIKSAGDRSGIRRYCPHATSHFLGLDVHDVGDARAPLAENMVVTCEPGIYIREEKIGVRIEDDVLITAEGNQVLSRKLPRRLHWPVNG